MGSLVDQFLGFAKYNFAITLLLFVFYIVGLNMLQICGFKTIIDKNQSILIGPVVGAATLSIPMVVIAHHQIAISLLLTWAVIIGLTLPLFVIFYLRKTRNGVSIFGDYFAWKKIGYLPVAAVVGLLPYAQLLIKPNFTPGLGTSATWTNNDLGAYIQMATNVSRAGVHDAGLVTGWNAGFQASFDHPSAHSFFAMASQILHKQPYQMGIVLMATVVSMAFLAAIFVLRQLIEYKIQTLGLLALCTLINPAIVAAICNFFFPQIISIAIVIGLLGLSLVTVKNNDSIGRYLLMSVLCFSVLFISVEMIVVLIPIAIGFAVLNGPIRDCPKFIVRFLTVNFVLMLIFAVLENDLVFSQIKVLTKLSATGVAGWKSNFVSPSLLFGLSPNQFGGPYSSGTRFFDSMILCALTVIMIQKFRENRRTLLFSTSLVFCFAIIGIASIRWGIDGYQTWKLVTSLSPFLFIFIILILAFGRPISRAQIAIFVALFTAGATFSWSASIWKDGQPSGYINKDLSQILNLKKTKSQTGLNISLAPFFETMAASVISGAPTHMSSPSYYFYQGQENLFRCTLTTEAQLPQLKNHGPVVAQRGTYVLVGTPACD